MKSYWWAEEALEKYPRECAVAEAYGFETALLQNSGNAALFRGGITVHAELPVITFYVFGENPDETVPLFQHAVLPNGLGGWRLEENQTFATHYTSRGVNRLPQQLGYRRKIKTYFDTEGLKPLDYVRQVIKHAGYPKHMTAPILALYDRHIGAKYLSAVDPAAPKPKPKVARQCLYDMGALWTYPHLTRNEKMDFAMREGYLTDLDKLIKTGARYPLIAEMFPYYQTNGFY